MFGILAAWTYIARLHATNDGLWYTGDAARHAANGIFWSDFVRTLPQDPRAFALSYYARYPVVDPVSYPPVFYLVEAAGFSIFGVSPFVAKALVLIFALLASVYVAAWANRWVSKEAGWAGMLFLLQPGLIVWSNAIMLNVPAMALGFAALYHGRRWLEAPGSKHLVAATAFAAAALLTYFPAVILLPVIPAWVIVERRWHACVDRRSVAAASLLAVLTLACLSVARIWAPLHVSLLVPKLHTALRSSHWTYYLHRLPELLSPSVLGLMPIGGVLGLRDESSRREASVTLLCLLICYFGLSVLVERESRYALFLVPPAVILAVVGVRTLAGWIAERFGRQPAPYFLVAIVSLIGFHVLRAPAVHVPMATGFREVVAFLKENAPDERVFYDGQYVGPFTFYVRAEDPGFKRGVVRGDKLLYASAILPRWRLMERISSPAEAVEAIRTRCGCRWLAIENGEDPDSIDAARYLRQAVAGPEFQLVKSFPVDAPPATRVDVYRFLPAAESPEEIELPFPVLGEGTILRARPLEGGD